MKVLIQAQIRQDKKPYEFNSTSVRIEIPDALDDDSKEEMLEAGRMLAWNRLFRFAGISVDKPSHA